MQHIVLATLMVNLVAGALYAQDRPVNVTMTSSGDSLATTIDLQADTITDLENLGGDGTLGAFTYHGLRTDAEGGTAPPTCSTPLLYVRVATGAGVFRFDDGSLLVVTITGGGLCIDLDAGKAQLMETYVISRGTGGFARASGNLTLTATIMPVVFNTSGNPQLLTISGGKFEGTIRGIGHGRDRSER